MAVKRTSNNYYNIKIIDEDFNIHKSQIKTLFDLKKAVEKISGVEISNQKLIRNNKKIAEPNQTLLQTLNILDKDKLSVLTIKPMPKNTKDQSKQKEIKGQEKTLKLQQSTIKLRPKSGIKNGSIQQARQFLVRKGCKQAQKYANISKGDTALALELWKKKSSRSELTFLTSEHIDRILISLIQNGCFRQYQKQIMINGNIWQFILDKISRNNPGLAQIFQQYPQKMMLVRNSLLQLEPPLSQSEQSMLIDRLNDFAAKNKLVQQLSKKIKQRREKIIEAVSISQNCIDTAIQILYEGSQKYFIHIQEVFAKDQDEQFFLLQFLAKQESIKRIKLAIIFKYLDIYTIAMKYRCKKIFDMLIKHRKFVQKMVVKYQPQLNAARKVNA